MSTLQQILFSTQAYNSTTTAAFTLALTAVTAAYDTAAADPLLCKYLQCNIFGFLSESKKYLENATLQRSLAFQMSVLEKLEKGKHLSFGPILKIRHHVEI